ncbi:MAG TPA: aldo/keto reductase [Candidatus Aphodousia faecipullorum]|nr:aldo/keto reductase [Candidatus Aphodousia faecipullorum]
MKTTLLNNGVEMPLLGYGVYQIGMQDCERCVREALDVGYRSIDTAQAYYNEEAVGRAIQASSINREELFITTKVWISNAGEENAAKSIDESLRKLQTDYIDLLLIHQPYGDYYGTYRAMQKAYASGKVRAIGLSNFYNDRFVDLVENVEIKPAVLQIETHVFFQQQQMRALAQTYGTKIMAWAPLAEGKNRFFENDILAKIGQHHGKSIAQVALNFLTAQDIIVIPKSVHHERMAENFSIEDFSLSEEEMRQIRTLDTAHPLLADFTNPEFVKFLLNYSKNSTPQKA